MPIALTATVHVAYASTAAEALSHARHAAHSHHSTPTPAHRGWVAYAVRHGDTVFDIAAARHTSVSAIVAVNRLADGGRLIQPGQRLLVPPTAHQRALAARPTYITHVVRRGDTVLALAGHYHVSPATLLKVNHLDRRGRIYVGQHLRVPISAARAAAKHRAPAVRIVSHQVRSGDSVSALALHFHVTQAAIRKANHLNVQGFLTIGQKLRIPVPVPAGGASKASSANTFAGRTYSRAVVSAANHNRQLLARRQVPSRTATRALIIATAKHYGVDPALALAVAWQESGWNQRAVSVANAIGTMQVVPNTGVWASQLAGHRLDLLKTQDNVTAGVVVLHALLRSAPTSQAIAGYYQGLGSVRANGMFKDTQAYVRSILALRARFH